MTIPSTGEPIEIFTAYGSAYEDIRVQKGYSELEQEEQNQIRARLETRDTDFLYDIENDDDLKERDMVDCVKFLFNLYNSTGSSSIPLLAKERSIQVLKRIEKRCLAMREAGDTWEIDKCLDDIESLFTKLGTGASAT